MICHKADSIILLRFANIFNTNLLILSMSIFCTSWQSLQITRTASHFIYTGDFFLFYGGFLLKNFSLILPYFFFKISNLVNFKFWEAIMGQFLEKIAVNDKKTNDRQIMT